MAHEFETGFFVQTPAWHGLGHLLPQAPTVEDAIRMSGLDWTVRTEPLQIASDGRTVSHRATVRDSDNSILGIVGPEYEVLQNSEAFAWFQPLVDSGEVKLEAAGSLREGRRIWILGSVQTAAEITPGDEIRNYILLANGHDGTLAVRVGFTSVRVVCQNTLSASLDHDKETLLKVKHFGNVSYTLDRVRSAMDLSKRNFALSAEAMRKLAQVRCSDDLVKMYAREVFAGPGKANDERAVPRVVKNVVELFHSGRGSDLPGVRGTLWGAYNAITEQITWNKGRTVDARVDSNWFGPNASLTKRALNVGLSFAA